MLSFNLRPMVWTIGLWAIVMLQAACMTTNPKTRLPLSAGLQTPPGIFLRDGKRLVYEDSGGTGPVIVCIPGLGDSRAQFRVIGPRLAKAGYRVLALDPRGQGASDTGWSSYAADALGDDTAALLDHLDLEGVYLVGNSAGAAVAAWAAAVRPERVRGVVLIAPFVRDVTIPWHQRAMLRIGFAGPWAAALWVPYYKSLYPTSPPADLAAYTEALKANLKEPGRLSALKAMLWASKAPVDARLGGVRAPALVVMGEQDADFSDPAAEAHQVAARVRGEVALIPGAGHYPHVELPDMTLASMTRFFDAH